MRKISVAFTHKLDFQTQLLTLQLQKLFIHHHLSEQITVDWVYDDHGIKLVITYPLPKSDERLSCARSLDYLNSNFSTLQHRILPLYFGNRIELGCFDIAGDSLEVIFTAKGVGEYLLNRIGYPVFVSEIEVPPANALSISHQMDRIIGDSGLKMLYRLPNGIPIWERIRLREVLYSLEYYQLGNRVDSPTLMRLQLLQRGGVKEHGKLDRLLSGIDEHLSAADIIDYSIAYSNRRGIYTEVRVII